jgi:hypothetical protein
VKVGDIVSGKKADDSGIWLVGIRLGTVIQLRIDKRIPPACKIMWDDGKMTCRWQCDVDVISEAG